MKKYLRVMCWLALFILSIAALTAGIVSSKNIQLLPSIIAVVFTAIITVVEFIKVVKKK